MAAFDTFIGLPLNQSIASATWDSGAITWAVKTFLAGNGSDAVKSTQVAPYAVLGNYLSLSGQIGQAVCFRIAPGRDTTGNSIAIFIDASGTLDEYAPGDGVKASVGSYGALILRDMAAGLETSIACATADNTDYWLEAFKSTDPSGKVYTANVYANAAGARGALLKTLNITLATALAGTNRRVQLATIPTNHPLLTINRVESIDAAVADTIPPTLSTSAVANATPSVVTMTMSEAMDAANVPAASAFTVTGHTVSSVAISGSTISLTCSTPFVNGEAARTVSYAQPGTANARDLAGNLLANFSTQAITNNVAALPAAVLSSPAGTATGTTTASATVSTTIGSGTLYALFSINATETSATIKTSGTSQAVSAVGTQTATGSGLTPATGYFSHFVQVANGQDSNVANGSGFTTAAVAAPVLSSASATAVTATTATANVSTTVGSGTLYAYASVNATETVATIKASGTSKAVTATGAQTVALTVLPSGTVLFLHFVHTGASDSGVLNSTSFTTATVTGSFVGAQMGSAGTLCANQTFNYEWHAGGTIGSVAGTVIYGTGTLSAVGVPTITGLPLGAGYGIFVSSTGVIAYQAGTVA